MAGRVLTVLVAVMGLMILGGIAVLGAKIAGRVGHPVSPSSTVRETVAPPASLRPFAAPPIAMPAGASVEAIGTGTDRVVIAIALPDGDRQLVVIDLASGRQVGSVLLRSAH